MNDSTEIVKAYPAAPQWGAERCVLVLEELGGDLEAFVKETELIQDHTPEWIIAFIERGLKNHDDKMLLKRWNDAIKARRVIELRRLQHRSIARLKLLAEGDESLGKAPDWAAMAKEAAAHKMLLGDVFAAQTFLAKQKPVIIEDDSDDEEDAELAKILGSA